MFISRILLAFCIVFVSVCSYSQRTSIIKFDDLSQIMENDSDQVRVINFWATWCSPCVKELPHFETINKKKGVEVVLVSLDFAENVSKVDAFIAENSLQSKVVLLDEIDYNSWIDKVNSSWSGTIPATLILAPRATRQKFIEGEITQEKLNGFFINLKKNNKNMKRQL